jgi:hypothetical protein
MKVWSQHFLRYLLQSFLRGSSADSDRRQPFDGTALLPMRTCSRVLANGVDE